jgi:hypothetical protein
MKMIRAIHLTLLVLAVSAAVLADLATHSHAVWIPTALAAVTELRKVLGAVEATETPPAA